MAEAERRKMEKIGLPKILEEKISESTSSFTIEPLYPGYGPTIGNALRRVLLSSITGAAATSFKVDGINHEFTSIPHVKEDMLELLMNLKKVSFKSFSEEPVVLELVKKGPGEATAADFKPNSNIEIGNPSQHLMSLDHKADVRIEVVVEKDRGFRASSTDAEKREIGHINVDASFSPIERVKLDIGDVRVGQMTNFDKLMLEVTTNGTITPSDALKEASRVLVDHYNAIISDETYQPELTEKFTPVVSPLEEVGGEEGVNAEVDEDNEMMDDGSIDGKTKIEDADFSPRTTNALLNSGIKTIAGLKRLSSLKLEEIKGLGKKGIEEIRGKLEQ